MGKVDLEYYDPNSLHSLTPALSWAWTQSPHRLLCHSFSGSQWSQSACRVLYRMAEPGLQAHIGIV